MMTTMRRIRGEPRLLLLLVAVVASLLGLSSAFLLPGPVRSSSPSSLGACGGKPVVLALRVRIEPEGALEVQLEPR